MTNARLHRRAGSASDDDHVDLAIVRVQPRQRVPRYDAAVVLVAALVVIAMVKPWGGGAPTTPTFRTDIAVVAEATPEPTEDRSATGLAAPVCLGAGAWQVASLETWRSRPVRVWRAIEPVMAATGPLDPAIPAVPVVADSLSGLGWCAPAYGPAQPAGPSRVQAWQVVDGAARPLFLRQVQPVDGVTPIAALYLPVDGPWVAGLVVFQYRDGATDTMRWFGADVTILPPAPGDSPAPTVAPPASEAAS
jgi:hypothetical protein